MWINLVVATVLCVVSVSQADLYCEYDASIDAETSTNTWVDQQGHQNLTFNTATTAASDLGSSIFSYAYEFGGSSSLTEAAVGSGWQSFGTQGSSATYEIWLRADAINADKKQTFFTFGGTGYGFSINLDTNGTFVAYAKDNVGGNPDVLLNSSDATTLVTGSEFMQVVLTMDETTAGTTTATFYLNGVSDTNQVWSGSLNYAGGADGGLARWFNNSPGGIHPDYLANTYFTAFAGDIALVRLYNNNSSAAEVKGLYDAVVKAAKPKGTVFSIR